MPLKWTSTKEESETALKIAKRAKALGVNSDLIDIQMDIEATHCNGCPLDLDRFLAFPDFDFLHDVCGIRDHLSRKTGKLGDFFLPRCTRRQAVAEVSK